MTITDLQPASMRMIDFLRSVKLEDLPASVRRHAPIRLLDGLGCAVFGATMPWGRLTAEIVYDEASQGGATVLGHSKPVAPARAAFVNGTAAHGMELDDIAPGHAHPGAMIVPAVLAVAEQYDLSGERVVLGLVAGYEVASRVGSAIGEVGWAIYLPSIVGSVAAAVAAGIALDLERVSLMRALGAACSFTGGIRSFLQGDGGMIKRMHAGRAAESGVLACLLAKRGFTAPMQALDGKFGLLEAFAGDNAKPARLDAGLGEAYVIDRVWTKMYPCCGGLHSMAQALAQLRTQHSLDHSAVSGIRVGVDHRAMDLHTGIAPKETMAAQYSMPYTAAVALIRDARDPGSYMGDALNDPVVAELARRVELHLDPEIDAIYPGRHGANVEVKLKNGQVLTSKLLDAKGTSGDPCTDEELKEKFRRLVSGVIRDEGIEEIIDAATHIEQLHNMNRLSSALRNVCVI